MEHAKKDNQIAYPWLITMLTRIEFLLVLAHKGIQLAKKQNTMLFDVSNTQIENRSDECVHLTP